uniref:Uncharacterized protein n=1 Tax=Anguilla anguilla TaxID=7936 RepID=A0A0E9WYW0_ANGAN
MELLSLLTSSHQITSDILPAFAMCLIGLTRTIPNDIFPIPSHEAPPLPQKHFHFVSLPSLDPVCTILGVRHDHTCILVLHFDSATICQVDCVLVRKW